MAIFLAATTTQQKTTTTTTTKRGVRKKSAKNPKKIKKISWLRYTYVRFVAVLAVISIDGIMEYLPQAERKRLGFFSLHGGFFRDSRFVRDSVKKKTKCEQKKLIQSLVWLIGLNDNPKISRHPLTYATLKIKKWIFTLLMFGKWIVGTWKCKAPRGKIRFDDGDHQFLLELTVSNYIRDSYSTYRHRIWVRKTITNY